MSRWVAFCADRYQSDVARLVQSLDATAELSLLRSADGLRGFVQGSVPGELSVLVGPADDGVSDINLAAAIANDGNANRVVLAREGVSGSFRSRAARAGIDLVVDLAEVGGGGDGDTQSLSLDGGHGDARTNSGGKAPSSPSPRSGRTGPGHRGVPAERVPEVEPGAAASGAPSAPDAAVEASFGGLFPGDGPSEGTHAPILTFCSGRGGVGKTALVAACAVCAASWGMRVTALDLDLSCGNLHSCFGLPHGSDLARLAEMGALTQPDLEGLCVAAASGVRLAGPCERPETAELAFPGVGALLSAAARSADLVLVDTSTTFTDAVAQAAQMADRLVLVSDGEPGSLAALSRSGGLAVRLGVARTRIVRLENRANPRAKADFSLARAEVGLEAARVFRTFEGGDEVCELLAAGRAEGLVGSGLPFAESVATMLAQLLAELGRLPACEEASRAAEGSTTRRWPALFGRAREAR